MLYTPTDYSILAANLGIAATDFTSGNLNADGMVSALDLEPYLSRGGVVPEPTAVALLVAALGCGWRRRRR